MTTLEQIRALALQGVGMRGVEATIGRPLTAEERTTYDRAATVRRLKAVADQRAARTEREAKAKAAADARAARKRERELALIAAAPKPADGEKAAYITRKVLGEALAARVITAAEFDLAAAPDARSQRNSIPVRAIHAKIRYWQDRRERRERAAQTNADRKAASVSRRYNITEIPPVADPARRRRCERSALFFLRHYCTACRGGFLATPVPAQMRGIVHAMQRCIETGVPYHIRMPRGLGKTSIMKGVVLWALATGRAHFVESAAATRDKATGIITDIWNCMQRSPDFKADFPEISAFMERTRGNPRTAPSIMWQGKAAGLQKSADGFHLPRIEIDSKPTPSSGAIMKAFGFSAAVRGEVEGDMRPDIIIFDDLQDRELASSPARVQEAIRTLDADFLGGTSHTR